MCRLTFLTEEGVDALVPVLMALGLVAQDSDEYHLTALGEEYFLPESPYYVGAGMFRNCEAPIPRAYIRSCDAQISVADDVPSMKYTESYFKSQISRNLAAGVHAVRSGRFEGISHLVDIGGGAGSIAVPFAQDYPDARVSLVDLPEGVEIIGDMLASYRLTERLHLVAADVFRDTWAFQGADAILFGNFFHIFSDPQCRFLSKRCFDTLPKGGRVFLHEILFDEGRSGPLVAALWNANMRVIGGRQRTSHELLTMLQDVGFSDLRSTSTASRFQLIEGIKR